MIEKIIELSILSGGLLPLMAILFFFNVTVVIERVYFFFFLYKSTIGNIRKLEDSKFTFDTLNKNDHEAMTPSELIFSLTNEVQSKNDQSYDLKIESINMNLTSKLQKNIWVLDVSVTLGPLLGLLGTIIGMVHAFDILGTSGSGMSASQMVSGGIAEALIATGFGLLIAILAVIFLSIFNKLSQTIIERLEMVRLNMLSKK
jgi:biopolymer transport protein ExbB